MQKLKSTQHTNLIHKQLDMVRRLENQNYIFATSPKDATKIAKNLDGSAFERCVKRAELIDSDGHLKNALHRNEFLMKIARRGYYIAYFLLGYLAVFGLLGTQIVSFFYVFLSILGLHTLTLFWWVLRLKKPKSYSWLSFIFDKLRPQKPLDKTAFDIYQEEFFQKDGGKWQIGKLIHQVWLFGLFGNLLALLGLFLFKSYAFIWESTLLSNEHFAQALSLLSIIPSFLGLNVPTTTELLNNQATPASLAILMMASVVLYGILPRYVAYLYCAVKAKGSFRIDKNLFYYENLLRQYSQTIIDKDDYIPSRPNPAKAVIDTKTKLVATLERPAIHQKWYQAGAGTDAKDVGVIDSKDDIRQAVILANTLNAQIYLGIDTHTLPDRGVLRKFDTLVQGGKHGLVVEFFGDGQHLGAWHEALVARGVAEVHQH